MTEYRDTVCVTAPFVQVITSNDISIPLATHLHNITVTPLPLLLTRCFVVLEHLSLWIHTAVESPRTQQADETVPEYPLSLRLRCLACCCCQ